MKSTTVIPVALAFLLQAASALHAGDAEETAVQAIEKVRGKIIRDEDAPGKPVVAVHLNGIRVARTGADLKNLVPHLAAFENLDKLVLFAYFPDAEMKELARLTQLHTLDLVACPITGAGLKALAPLNELQSLSLRWTKVANAGLKELTAFKELRNLDISITPVTDAGLKHLAPLTKLHWLDLSNNRGVADAGMKEVARLENLQTLWVYGTSVGDAGLEELAALEKLDTLRVENSNITDAGLKELAPLKKLRILSIGANNNITDAGLKPLADLKQLRQLDVRRTKVTAPGIEKLQRALPHCEILY